MHLRVERAAARGTRRRRERLRTSGSLGLHLVEIERRMRASRSALRPGAREGKVRDVHQVLARDDDVRDVVHGGSIKGPSLMWILTPSSTAALRSRGLWPQSSSRKPVAVVHGVTGVGASPCSPLVLYPWPSGACRSSGANREEVWGWSGCSSQSRRPSRPGHSPPWCGAR